MHYSVSRSGRVTLPALILTGTPATQVAGQPESRRTFKGHTDTVYSVYSVAFSPDGKTLASGSFDKSIKLWNMASGKNTATLKGHTDAVISVAFSPDGKTLASGSQDKSIRLWDLAPVKKY